MIKAIEINDGRVDYVNPSAIKELEANNCTLPDVKSIIFNLKTTEKVTDPETGATTNKVLENPVLTTVVTFVDETRVVVKNGGGDKITLEDKVLSDGSTVKVADKRSKEAGITAAIFKRLVTTYDNYGNPVDAPMAKILTDLIDNYSLDQVTNAAESKIQKAAAKAKHEESIKNAKPKVKNPSLVEVVRDLSEAVKTLNSSLANKA